MKFTYIFVLFSLLFGIEFETSIGKCKLQLYNNSNIDQFEIIQLIKKSTFDIVNKYGKVKQSPYFIYITNTIDEFEKIAKGPIPEWGVAVAKKNPDRAIIKSPHIANINFTRMKQIIVHEINHIYIYRVLFNKTIPSWFKEGFAMHTANEFNMIYKMELSKALFLDRLIPLNKLRKIIHYDNNQITLAYAQSACTINALEYIYGNDIVYLIIQNMQQGMTFNDSFKKSTGFNIEHFESEYLNYLENNYNWLLLFKIPKYIYAILAFILIFGYIYRSYKNKIIIKKWEIEDDLDDSEI